MQVGPAPPKQVPQQAHAARGRGHQAGSSSSYTPVKDRRSKRTGWGMMMFSALSVLSLTIIAFFFLPDGAIKSLKIREYFNSKDQVAAVEGSSSKEQLPDKKQTSPEIVKQSELEEARSQFVLLDFSSRARVQKWLALNFDYKSTIDGLWGPSTAASMSKALIRLPNAETAFYVALMEVPPSAPKKQPVAAPEPTNSDAVSRERYIAQLLLACSISPAGTLGERLADSQLYAATGQRCAKPTPAAPIMPTTPGVAPNQPPGMNCQFRSKPQLYRIPGMYYPPTLECW